MATTKFRCPPRPVGRFIKIEQQKQDNSTDYVGAVFVTILTMTFFFFALAVLRAAW